MARSVRTLELLRTHVHGRRPRAVVTGALVAAEATRIPRKPAIRAMAALAGTSLACAAGPFAPTRVDGDAGSATAIAHWQIQSSAKAQQSGAEGSSSRPPTRDWYRVSGRATVMAGLLENGTYQNVFYSDNLRAVEEPDSSGNLVLNPRWDRTQVTMVKRTPGEQTTPR